MPADQCPVDAIVSRLCYHANVSIQEVSPQHMEELNESLSVIVVKNPHGEMVYIP